MYDPKFCDRIKQHCRDGHSILSFLSVLDEDFKISIRYETLLRWADDHEDFGIAIGVAQAAEIFFWEERAAIAMKNGESQTLQMAKFMLDQKYMLFEKIYKKTFNTSTIKDMSHKRISQDNADPDRDMLLELKDG